MDENADKQKLISLMEEASLLPKKNAKREEVERTIEKFTWAKKNWEILNKEQAIIHKSLCDIECPAHLKQKLLVIPTTSAKTSFRYLNRGIAIAATIVFILGYLFFPSAEVTLENLAVASVKWHLSPLKLDVVTSDRTTLLEHFVEKAGFSPNWTKVDDRFSLLGGKVVLFDQKPILYSLWNTSLGNCTLVQFQAKDFHLPTDMKKAFWDKDTPALGNCLQEEDFLCMVWIKNNDGHIWILNNGEEQKKFFHE